MSGAERSSGAFNPRERIRGFSEEAPDGIVATDPRGRFILVNRRATLLTLPTRDFPANLAFFHLALFAYHGLNWFKRYCAPPEFQRATLQRLRQQPFLAPAHLVGPGGRPTLRRPASYPHQQAFRDLLKRIEEFTPPWVK